MATELDKLIVKIQADISGLKKGLDKANAQTKNASKKMSSSMNQFGQTMDRIGKRVLAFGSVIAVAFGTYQIKKIVDAGRQVEDLQVRLKALFGTAEEGAKSFQVMLEYAGKVPFSLEEIQRGAGNLAVVAKNADELKEILFVTGNVAATTGLDFRQTAEQIQRSFSSGIASADVFRERGVGAMLGFQKGAEVSVAETVRVFKETFGKGGKFGNVTKDLATTLTGTLSMLGDKLLQFRLAISETFMVEIKKRLSGMNDALQKATKDVEKLGNEIGNKLASAVALFADNIDVIIRGLTALAVFLTGAMGVAIVSFVAGLGAIGVAVASITTAYTLWGDEIIASYGWLWKKMKLLAGFKASKPHEAWERLRDAVEKSSTQMENSVEKMGTVIVTEEQMKEITQDLSKTFEDAGKDISDAFGKAVISGKSFRDSMRSILVAVSEQIVATIAQILIIDPLIRKLTNSLKEYQSAISTSGGSLLDSLIRVGVGAFAGGMTSSAVTPEGMTVGSDLLNARGQVIGTQQQPMSYSYKANGGFVAPNMPYMVGERGAEMFVPKSAGNIIPNSEMGGNVVINQSLNFSTGVVPTVRTEIMNLMPQIKKETVSAVAEARSRGGTFARTFGA